MSDGLLFEEKERFESAKSVLGHAAIEYTSVGSILTPATGFIGGYDFTLNPYSGCSFGCGYCYAAGFSKTEELRGSWGKWVNVKRNALDLLKRQRSKPLLGKSLYISSVTDPYQPIERDLSLTRDLLIELGKYHKVRVVIQTRSPLVERDIDVLKAFEFVQVNVTITTDSERVRRVFEPFCPSNQKRLDTVKALSDSGIKTVITMTPLLPVEDASRFAENLKLSGASDFVVQNFHEKSTRFAAGTPDQVRVLLAELQWDEKSYKEVFAVLKEALPTLSEGKVGFKPRFEEVKKIRTGI